MTELSGVVCDQERQSLAVAGCINCGYHLHFLNQRVRLAAKRHPQLSSKQTYVLWLHLAGLSFEIVADVFCIANTTVTIFLVLRIDDSRRFGV